MKRFLLFAAAVTALLSAAMLTGCTSSTPDVFSRQATAADRLPTVVKATNEFDTSSARLAGKNDSMAFYPVKAKGSNRVCLVLVDNEAGTSAVGCGDNTIGVTLNGTHEARYAPSSFGKDEVPDGWVVVSKSVIAKS